MNVFKATVLLFCCVIAITACTEESGQPEKPDQMIIIGDSYSDPGNMYQLTGNAVPVNPPYSQGRFSNGPVWAEKVDSVYNLKDKNFQNFAYGGANTDSTNVMYQMIPPSSPKPFLKVRKAVHYTGVLEQIEELRQKDIQPKDNGWVVIWSGSNDYNLDTLATEQEVDAVINDMGTAITRLSNMGWKNFVIFNLDYELASPEFLAKGGTGSPYYKLAEKHDQLLSKRIPEWKKEHEANIKLFDLDGVFGEVANNPQKYGFTDLKTPCYNGGKMGFFQQTSKVKDCKGHFYWDGIGHPTTAAHEVIADEFLSFMKNR